jgi:tetratricopeptide (TPR) repeat protein
VNAQDGLVNIALVRGRLREAERQYAQATEARARVRGDTVSQIDVASFHAMVDGLLRGDVSRGLAALDAAQRATAARSVPVARDRSLFLVMAYSRLGSAARAREVLTRYEARLDEPGRRSDAVFLARLRGLIALAEGKADSAITWFRRGDVEADGLPTVGCSPCTPLLVGMAFDRGGHADSARKYLTDFAEMAGSDRPFIDRYYLAPTLFRLGELYESAGDTKAATEYYGRFVDLWAHADQELQPRVAEARTRIERLNRPKQ